MIVRQQKCIEPLGESKSDYEIFAGLSERLGLGDVFTDGGKTELDWGKAYFDAPTSPRSRLGGVREEGLPRRAVPGGLQADAGLRWFAEGRTRDTPDWGNPKRGTDKAHELGTYQRQDRVRAREPQEPLPGRPGAAGDAPRYIASWEGHHTTELFGKYPLQLVSPHPRFSFHCHYDKHTDWLERHPGAPHQEGRLRWWPVRLSPADADARGIRNGDIVRLYNDRGSVLCCAVVTERVRPGVAHSYASSAKYDPLEPGKADSIDKGGCVNMLTRRGWSASTRRA